MLFFRQDGIVWFEAIFLAELLVTESDSGMMAATQQTRQSFVQRQWIPLRARSRIEGLIPVDKKRPSTRGWRKHVEMPTRY